MGLKNRISTLGDLDCKITIHHITNTATGTGGFKEVRSSTDDVWARRNYDPRTSEDSEAGMELSYNQVCWEFPIPFSHGEIGITLTPKDEITFRGETYDIMAINILGRDQYWQVITQLRS